MQSNLVVKRQWLPFGFRTEYNLSEDLPKFKLARLVDLCLRQLCPAEVFSATVIRDFKGRDQLNLINSDIAEHEKPSGDEILFISGEIYTQEPGPDGLYQPESISPFEIRVNSSFKEFVGSHHIDHLVKILRRGDFADELSVKFLGIMFPMKIKKFRLGLDFFESKFLSGMFGFAPTVTQSLLIECDEKRLSLRINADQLATRNTLPLSAQDIFQRLDRVLEAALGIQIKMNYQQTLLK